MYLVGVLISCYYSACLLGFTLFSVFVFVWVWLSQMRPLCVVQASLELSVWIRQTDLEFERILPPLPAKYWNAWHLATYSTYFSFVKSPYMSQASLELEILCFMLSEALRFLAYASMTKFCISVNEYRGRYDKVLTPAEFPAWHTHAD